MYVYIYIYIYIYIVHIFASPRTYRAYANTCFSEPSVAMKSKYEESEISRPKGTKALDFTDCQTWIEQNAQKSLTRSSMIYWHERWPSRARRRVRSQTR